MPRTDLKVKVHGVDVKAGFALGSYATFKKMGNGTMMMGDLVLLDEEIAGRRSGAPCDGAARIARRERHPVGDRVCARRRAGGRPEWGAGD